jgi:hypothetical protein
MSVDDVRLHPSQASAAQLLGETQAERALLAHRIDYLRRTLRHYATQLTVAEQRDELLADIEADLAAELRPVLRVVK